MKSVRTLGYDQPTDVTIRKTLGLTFIFKSGKNVFVRRVCYSQLALCFCISFVSCSIDFIIIIIINNITNDVMIQGSCRFSPDPSPRRGWGLGTRLGISRELVKAVYLW